MNDAVERIALDVHAHQAPTFPDDLNGITGCWVLDQVERICLREQLR